MIRLLSCVDAHVALERLKMAEVRPADLAGVRFFSGMDQHMSTKVGHLEGNTNIKTQRSGSSAEAVLKRCTSGTWTNLEPHVSHLYGFSPEWIRACVFRLAGRLNWAPQMLQRYGFAPGS